ncbi:TRAP transporter small permease [Salipaludibacillus aurantiacus]|uniref:TRAP-type C4-dicarboxylate transport system, small permease component n=1 Tax=Salipaludibacillus aurantiacus TaxID=1601833 RepID=A0A1H9UAZ9_9BACI|nr:TRAP transporter small permease [Salipaludibacillus aurantiacus]SES06334.1 TRAP-type C4-dicarboxylate transport system, small permease component [Salipaludibacillus aurantiacus]
MAQTNTQKKKNWFEYIIDWTELAASVLLIGLTITVFGEVLSRYVFRAPLVFSNELTQLLFPWLIFVAAISVTKQDGHLAVSYFRDQLPYRLQKILFLFSKVVMLFFSVYMAVASFRYVDNVSNQIMPVMRISRGWLSASVTVAFIFISIILIYQIVMILLNKLDVPREEDALDDLGHDR